MCGRQDAHHITVQVSRLKKKKLKIFIWSKICEQTSNKNTKSVIKARLKMIPAMLSFYLAPLK